jgi:hypothetical protein
LAADLPFSRKLIADKHVESYRFPCLDVGSTPTISTRKTINALIINRLDRRYFFGLQCGLLCFPNRFKSGLSIEADFQLSIPHSLSQNIQTLFEDKYLSATIQNPNILPHLPFKTYQSLIPLSFDSS